MTKLGEENEIVLEEKHLVEMYRSKKDLPKKIRLEACTLCQLNCVCCPVKTSPEEIKRTYGYGYLSFENFKKLVDNNNFIEVELSARGEIFLNPELIDIIKYAYRKKIQLTAKGGVNLNTLSDEMAENLVRYGFMVLTISIDGASQETYSKYRVGGDYNKVIENIKKIQYYKEKYHSEYPYIKWKFVVFGHNEHEIVKAKKEARKLKIPIFFTQNQYPWYSPIVDKKFVFKETNISESKSDEENTLLRYQKNKDSWLYCKELWTNPQINWDGKFYGCCRFCEDEFGSNVFKKGLFESLNSPKLIYAKNMLTGKAEPIPGIPCTNCDVFKKMQGLNLNIERPLSNKKDKFSLRKHLRRLKNDLLIFYYEKTEPRLK